MRINEIAFNQFSPRNMIASMTAWGWSPAIGMRGDGYYIRVLTGYSHQGNNISSTYGYYNLDSTGLILESPRGQAKTWNKRVRINGMETIVEKYKDWHINEK